MPTPATSPPRSYFGYARPAEDGNIVRDDNYVCALCDADLEPQLPGAAAQAPAAAVQQLLDGLCTRFGFCLPEQEQERLRHAPPLDPEAFVRAVFAAEGMDPYLDRDTYRQVTTKIEHHLPGLINAARPDHD